MYSYPFHRISLGLLLTVLVFACQKRQEKSSTSGIPADIQSARNFFEKTVLSSLQAPTAANYRARLTKTIRWDLAQATLLSGQTAVIAPVQFAGNIYMSSDLAPGATFDLGSLTRLLISHDSNDIFHYGLLTYIPDSNAITTQSFNSGILLCEDWQGNSLSAPRRFTRKTISPTGSGDKEIDVIQAIQVCNTIDGYNYAPDDPAGGITNWTETSCNTYNLPATTNGPTLGSGSLPSIFGPKPILLTIQLSPPGNPIGNIADYFKCFTSGDAGHNFSVTLAVEQPVQGSREAWTFTSGGVSGSSQAGNPVNVGHSFLVFSEGDGGQPTTQRSVGFYPQGIVTPFSRSAQGVLGDDEYTDYNISLTISVTSSQFFTMLQYVTQGNNSGYMYDLNANNCTTFALDAIDAGGVSIPSTLGSWVGNGQGLDPGDLGEDIRNMQLPGNMSRNTVSNSHPNIGTCN